MTNGSKTRDGDPQGYKAPRPSAWRDPRFLVSLLIILVGLISTFTIIQNDVGANSKSAEANEVRSEDNEKVLISVQGNISRLQSDISSMKTNQQKMRQEMHMNQQEVLKAIYSIKE